MSKYRNVATLCRGIRFASKAEAAHYEELRLLERAGEIRDLRLQPHYPLVVTDTCGNPVTVARYIADFSYEERITDTQGRQGWVRVVSDVKGVRTALYALKAKLFHALYGFEVREVRTKRKRRAA